jgi:hypothetical protein
MLLDAIQTSSEASLNQDLNGPIGTEGWERIGKRPVQRERLDHALVTTSRATS